MPLCARPRCAADAPKIGDAKVKSFVSAGGNEVHMFAAGCIKTGERAILRHQLRKFPVAWNILVSNPHISGEDLQRGHQLTVRLYVRN